MLLALNYPVWLSYKDEFLSLGFVQIASVRGGGVMV